MSEPPNSYLLPDGPLPAKHRCRSDDLAYTSVSNWYRDHAGRVPIQAAAGLDRYMRAHACTFAEAFIALTGRGRPIILIEEKPTRRSVRDRTREIKR